MKKLVVLVVLGIVVSVVMGVASASATPMYRFFKPSTGTHFYTSNPAEKASIVTNLGGIYTYEGVSYELLTSAEVNGWIDSAKSSLRSDLTALGARVGLVETDVEVLQSRVTAGEGLSASLGSRIILAESSLGEISSRLDAAESAISTLEGRVDLMEAGGGSPLPFFPDVSVEASGSASFDARYYTDLSGETGWAISVTQLFKTRMPDGSTAPVSGNTLAKIEIDGSTYWSSQPGVALCWTDGAWYVGRIRVGPVAQRPAAGTPVTFTYWIETMTGDRLTETVTFTDWTWRMP